MEISQGIFTERESLYLGVNMLTNGLKTWNTPKRDFFELKFFQSDEKV